MTSVRTTLFATAMLAGFGISSASALPVSNLGAANASTVPHVDQVRMVCNQWGHCWWRPNYYYGGYGPYYNTVWTVDPRPPFQRPGYRAVPQGNDPIAGVASAHVRAFSAHVHSCESCRYQFTTSASGKSNPATLRATRHRLFRPKQYILSGSSGQWHGLASHQQPDGDRHTRSRQARTDLLMRRHDAARCQRRSPRV